MKHAKKEPLSLRMTADHLRIAKSLIGWVERMASFGDWSTWDRQAIEATLADARRYFGIEEDRP